MNVVAVMMTSENLIHAIKKNIHGNKNHYVYVYGFIIWPAATARTRSRQNAPAKQFIIYVENLNNPICTRIIVCMNISGEDKTRIL